MCRCVVPWGGMEREMRGWTSLFSLGVQHLHEQRLCGSAAAAVLQVQALLASGGYVMNIGQHGQKFSEFVLPKTGVCG